MKIVSFEWKDAYGRGGWFNNDQIKQLIQKFDLWTYEAGYLVKKTKRELIICSSWLQEDSGCDQEEKFGNVQKIPMTWIRNYRVLRHTNKKKK